MNSLIQGSTFFSEELSRAQDFSLAEDNKHSKHVPSTRGDYIHILIKIKPLRSSLKIKFIQDYPRRLNQMIYYTCSYNNYTEMKPILWYKYKNLLCCSISCLIDCRLEICVYTHKLRIYRNTGWADCRVIYPSNVCQWSYSFINGIGSFVFWHFQSS